MSTARKCLSVLCLAFGLMTVLSATPAFAADKKEEKKDEKVAKIDVNTATEKELSDTLDGVGEVTAKKIVAGRPYKSVEDMVKKDVISEKVGEKIAKQVTFSKVEKVEKTEKKETKETTAKTDKKEATTKTDKKDEETAAKTPPKPGMVWVNMESKIYHKEGDRWYGKTKNGEFMTEADAIKAGARAAKEGGSKKDEEKK